MISKWYDVFKKDEIVAIWRSILVAWGIDGPHKRA